jgi:predicted nucleotidyltransferase
MNRTSKTSRKSSNPGLYYPDLVPLRAIRRYVRGIVERFGPERVVLFGSYAGGHPTPDSDVDLLVVMRTDNELDQALRIDEAFDRKFALDLIVRTPQNLRRRLAWGDVFLREVVSRGRVLYEKADGRVGAKGGRRLGSRTNARRRPHSVS